ncbi:MAG: metalloregulator ArsR/SmtB family transcription factor [Pseudomonadota bacterium]
MDAIFQALANASRRQMLDHVKASPGLTVGELAAQFDVSRIAVMKHLRVLEEARLVISRKDGRARRLYFNAVPIQLIHERWTTEYSAYWSGSLTRLKYAAEMREQSERNDRDNTPNEKGKGT